MKKEKQNKGFTIVELLIATGVFSVMIIVIATMIVQISRMYYKGIVLNNTQTAARSILDEISDPIQLENSTIGLKQVPADPVPFEFNQSGVGHKALCVGLTRYTYVEGFQQAQAFDPADRTIPHALWRDQLATPEECVANLGALDLTVADLSAVSPDGGDLLEEYMWLRELTVKSVPDKDIYSIEVDVLFGDRDLMNPVDPSGVPTADAPTDCRGAIAGSQWCAQSIYSTFVLKRIKN